MSDTARPYRAQSLVELALLLPVLVLLMLGTIDLARAFYVKVTLANAARTAATYAANYQLAAQYGTSGATQRVIAAARQEVSPLSDVQFSTTWQPGSTYTVTVSMQWSPITPMVSQLWGGGPLLLQHTIAMRHNCTAETTCVYAAPTPTSTPMASPIPTAAPTTPPTATVSPLASPTPTVTPTPTATPCPPVTVASGPAVTLVPSGPKHNATVSWTASVAGAGRVAVSKPNQALSNPLSGSPFAAGTGASHSATFTNLNSGTYQYQVQMQDGCTGTWQSAGSGTFVVP